MCEMRRKKTFRKRQVPGAHDSLGGLPWDQQHRDKNINKRNPTDSLSRRDLNLGDLFTRVTVSGALALPVSIMSRSSISLDVF